MTTLFGTRRASALLTGLLLSSVACTDQAVPTEFETPKEIWLGVTIRVERDPCPGARDRYLWFLWTDAVGERSPLFSIGPLPAETLVVTDLVVPDRVP